MEEHPSTAETIVSFLVVAMVAAQTWMVINEATDGELSRRVRVWWERAARPAIVRLVILIDARAIAETMVNDEIEPFLKERHGYSY